MLREVIKKEVVNIESYYYHKTLQVGGQNNNVNKNMQKGLDIIKKTSFSIKKLITIFNISRLNIKI